MMLSSARPLQIACQNKPVGFFTAFAPRPWEVASCRLYVLCQVCFFQGVLFPEFTRLDVSLCLLLYYLGIGNNFLEVFCIPVYLTTDCSNTLVLVYLSCIGAV